MSARPGRRILWLAGLAALLAAANMIDFMFPGDEPEKSNRATADRANRATKGPAVAAAPGTPLPSAEALRARLEHLRSVERSSAQVRETYAKVAIPYAETMALLPTYFPRGANPKAALESAVRVLAAGAGVEVESLLAATPQPVGPGAFEGLAKLSVRGGDSDAMLRFLALAGRPGNGMIWNGFQLTADAQSRQLSLAGELRVLLVESAE